MAVVSRKVVVLSFILVSLQCSAVLLYLSPSWNQSVTMNLSISKLWTWRRILKYPMPKYLSPTSLRYDSNRSTGSQKITPSRFLYLLQTESCLPSHLSSVEAIGNESFCQCDVLVLSYKNACKNTSLSHVKYLFNSSTSWGTGRNMLFEVAMKRAEKYLYYIFMDDDITLERRRQASINANPWRYFEDFLKHVEPAVGAVDSSCHPFLKRARLARKRLGCSSIVNDSSSDYITSARYDAAFNAFHYRAVEHILPYSTTFDSVAWCTAEIYGAIKCEVMFAGHTLLHTKLIARNPKHRSYPRNGNPKKNILVIIDEIERKLPEKYHNITLLKEWKKEYKQHEDNSPTYCLPPPPPHMPVQPFAYLEYISQRYTEVISDTITHRIIG